MYQEDDIRAYRVVTIDPGTDTLGICASEFLSKDNTITILDAYTIKTERLVRRHYEHVRATHGDRYAKLLAIRNAVIDYLDGWKPDFVCCEGSYLGSHASAFASGTEIQSVIRDALSRYNPQAILNVIDPARVKKSIGAKGNNGDKLLVRRCLSRLRNITSLVELSTLDEHAIDSVAIAYYYHSILKEKL